MATPWPSRITGVLAGLTVIVSAAGCSKSAPSERDQRGKSALPHGVHDVLPWCSLQASMERPPLPRKRRLRPPRRGALCVAFPTSN